MNRQPISPEDYSRLVSKLTPPSRHVRGVLRAFWVGGLICCIGQALNMLGESLELTELTVPTPMDKSICRFHRWRPATISMAISSGRPWLPLRMLTPRRQ